MSTNAPPTSEQGYVLPQTQLPGVSAIGIPGWGSFNLDEQEIVPALKWPESVHTYNRMRNDPQIDALLRGMTTPIRRFRWYIDADGAKASVVKQLSEDLGLNQKGKRRQRRKNTFVHDDHLRTAMLALVYGHQFFEMVGDIDRMGGAGRLQWRMRKLLAIPPRTIGEMAVARDGGLEWIRQKDELNPPFLKVNRLIGFIHDKEGANWFGRSLLRAAYQPWLLKDRLLRVDAIRHERNGMGVPIVELPERATDTQRKEGAALAEQYKVGVASGGALPFGMKLRLVGVEGQTSDVLASIRYHDEMMARLMLQMFTQLGGGGEYGSKALGDTFVKFFAKAQEAVADWYALTMNMHFIERWVDWNYGSDELPPLLKYERDDDPELSAHEFAQLVAQNVITVDEELENFIRDKYDLPELKGPRPKPQDFGLPTDPNSGNAPPVEGQPNENIAQPPPQRPSSQGGAGA